MTKHIHTLKGSIESEALGLVLPHEHLFTDLRGPHVPEYARGEPSAVVKVVEPYLAEEESRASLRLLAACPPPIHPLRDENSFQFLWEHGLAPGVHGSPNHFGFQHRLFVR
jgi:hypothetical protein